MPKDVRHRAAGFRRRALGLAASLAITFLGAEVLLRLLPLKLGDLSSEFRFEGDEEVGYRPTAGQDAAYDLDCLRNPHVRTNGEGLRGGEWGETRSPKVALLGDSFLLALTISERWHAASRLRAATGGEVWNAGVSGYGTYQELLVWRKLVARRRPDVTVLFFYLENDIRDSHCGLARAEGQKYSPCLAVEAGKVVERTDFEYRSPRRGLEERLLDSCRSCRLARRLLSGWRYRPASGGYFDRESFAYNVYRPGFAPSWEEGWKATEWALRALKRECEEAGSRLLVVNVPGMLPIAPDWRRELVEQLGNGSVPPDFQLGYPVERLRAMTAEAGVDFLDLLPDFVAYRDRYRLPRPYFGWCCDGHWNPLGHRLAADLVYGRLVERGWLRGEPPAPTPAPEEVLGPELMSDIYSCRTVDLGEPPPSPP